jgi:hypothetical protein
MHISVAKGLQTLGLLTGIGALAICAAFGQALAGRDAQTVEWTEPEVLARGVGYVEAVSDASGAVHLFFVDGYRSNRDLADRAVIYMRRDKEGWSTPVDVLVSPSQTEIHLNAVDVDAKGFLHLLWSDAQTLYHSTAHVGQASKAPGWQTASVLDGAAPFADMAPDPKGTLHVLARPNFGTISYLRSTDGGETWSVPEMVYMVSAPEAYAVGELNLVWGEPDNLYATWSLASAELDWTSWSVWFCRSLDGGSKWDNLEEIAAPRFGFPDVAVDGSGDVHLVWGRGIGSADGRWHQWSIDGGTTWRDRGLLFPQFERASGDTAGYGFALDGSGTLHMVNSFGQSGEDAAAYHLTWDGHGWSEPELVFRNNAHGARIVVSLGNRLEFFANTPGRNVLWYREGIVLAPPVAPRVIPTAPQVRQDGGVTVAPGPTSPPASVAPSPASTRLPFSHEARPRATGLSAMLIPLGLSAGFVLLVVVIARARKG